MSVSCSTSSLDSFQHSLAPWCSLRLALPRLLSRPISFLFLFCLLLWEGGSGPGPVGPGGGGLRWGREGGWGRIGGRTWGSGSLPVESRSSASSSSRSRDWLRRGGALSCLSPCLGPHYRRISRIFLRGGGLWDVLPAAPRLAMRSATSL